MSPELDWDYPHLAYLRRHLADVTLGTCPRLLLNMPAQHGKLIAHDTPVLTPSGWTTHGELVPGDRVFGSDGRPVEVVATSADGVADWEVEFSDGERIPCHGNHEWAVYDRAGATWRVMETTAMAATAYRSGDRSRFQVEWVPLEMPDRELPVDPYSLGAWLGDGTTSKPWITHAPCDAAVAEEVGRFYAKTKEYVHRTTGVVSSVYTGPRPGVPGEFWRALKAAGVAGDKHIPATYMAASEQQRRRLLAGLIDTDGYVHHRTRRVCFSTSDRRLAGDVAVLVRTFGWRATVAEFAPHTSTSGIVGRRPVFQVTFSPTGEVPCVLPRKYVPGFNVERRRRGVVAIRPIDPIPGRCIQVANEDGIYLVGRGLVPTHNSQLVTIRYALWRLLREPTLRVAVTAYGQKLANRFSRAARRLAREQNLAMGDVEQVDEWETAAGGSFLSRGMGAGITGNAVDLLVVDDPYKDAKQAKSPTYREAVWEWWTDALMKRLSRNAHVIVIHTRWHTDDLTGRLIKGGGWRHIKLKAIAEDGDEMGRSVGDPLCPDLHPLPKLEAERESNPVSFRSMGQQEPMDLEGGFFRGLEKLSVHEVAPTPDQFVRRVRAWDLASTEAQSGADPDYTVGVLMGKHKDGTFWLLDVVRERLGPGGVRDLIRQTAAADGPGVQIRVEREGGASGKLAAHDIVTRDLAGYPAASVRTKGSKAERAEPFAAQVEAGNVRMVRTRHAAAVLDEMRSFPTGSHDDIVDACSLGFAEAARPPGGWSLGGTGGSW